MNVTSRKRRSESEAMLGSGYGKRAGQVNAILGDLAGLFRGGAEARLSSNQLIGPLKTPFWPSSRVPTLERGILDQKQKTAGNKNSLEFGKGTPSIIEL